MNFKKIILAIIVITAPISAQLPVQTFTLSSGLRCFLVENHDKPIISIKLTNNWSTNELDGQQGLGGFLAAVITAKNTKIINDINYGKYINLGINHLAFSAQNGFYQWSLTADGRSQEAAMNLLAELVANPMFDSALIDRQRQAIIKQFVARSQQKIAIDHFLWSTNNSDALLPPDVALLNNFAYQDVLSFRRLAMHPTTSSMAIYGDLNLEQAKQLVFMYFGTWSPSVKKIVSSQVPTITNNDNKPKIWHLSETNSDNALWVGIPRPADHNHQAADVLLPIILNQAAKASSNDMQIDFSLSTTNNITLLIKARNINATKDNLVIQLMTLLDKIRKTSISQQDLRRALIKWKANNDTMPLHPQELLQKILHTHLNGNLDQSVALLTLEAVNQNMQSWLAPKTVYMLLFGINMPSQEDIKNAGLAPWLQTS